MMSGSERAMGNFVKVGKASDIDPGKGKSVEVGDRRLNVATEEKKWDPRGEGRTGPGSPERLPDSHREASFQSSCAGLPGPAHVMATKRSGSG